MRNPRVLSDCRRPRTPAKQKPQVLIDLKKNVCQIYTTTAQPKVIKSNSSVAPKLLNQF